jgi:hypothetical protein
MKGRLLTLVAGAIFALGFASITLSPAHAQADKIGVAADATAAFECSDDTFVNPPSFTIPCTDTDLDTVIDVPDSLTTNAVVLPAIHYKGSTTADLLLQFSTECTLFNYVKRNSDLAGEWAVSDAGVKIWIEIDDDPLPLSSVRDDTQYEDEETGAAPHVVKVSPADSDTPNGKVTFCQRIVGLAMSESGTAAGDITIETQLAIASMNANAFNWIMQNPSEVMGSNNYYIRVMGAIELANLNDAVSGAGFRQRTLIVEPVHLANGTTF